MLNLRLYLENIAGYWFGWIEDFPGACVQGYSMGEVERSAPRAFADYLNWLRLILLIKVYILLHKGN